VTRDSTMNHTRLQRNEATQTRYQERLARALQYIEDNLDQSLRLEDIAAASYFSPFHFHRIFQSLMGESVNDYVIRRRMESAAHLLVYERHLRVTDVAATVGYSSTANLSKAIKQYFGVSPSAIRNPSDEINRKIGKLSSKYGKTFDPRDLYPRDLSNNGLNDKEDKHMHVEVIEQEELTISYLSSPQGYLQESIEDTWTKLIAWAKSAGVPIAEQQYYALCYSNPAVTPVEKCRYDASVVVPPTLTVNAPFSRSVIPAGRYARVYYKGPSEGTSQAHLAIFNTWLPASGFEPDDYPSMEHYLNDVREDGFVEMEVFLKLKDLA